MEPALTADLEKDLIVSFARGGKKVCCELFHSLENNQFESKNVEMKYCWHNVFFFSFFGFITEKSSVQFCGFYGKMWEKS